MTVILVNREDALEVENEEKAKWVLGILEVMGTNVDNMKEPTMDNLRRLRKDLKKNDLDVIDDSSGGIEIYYKGVLIGEWRKPRYILREDPKERDIHYRYYLEMHIDCKSYLDQYKED